MTESCTSTFQDSQEAATNSVSDSLVLSAMDSSDYMSNEPSWRKSIADSYVLKDSEFPNPGSDEVAIHFDKRLLETCEKFKKETRSRALECLKQLPPANNEETIDRISKDMGLSPKQVREALMPKEGFEVNAGGSLKKPSKKKNSKAVVDACRCSKHKKKRGKARKAKRAASRRRRRRRR
ncbi:uncharacterized protein LOC119682039 [Teleopsis dalmanni]|uniref:uncharacterized protein LOC119682039 n=1 Tax=Teleopsis dalmanni TaxID=139649 RepID=UPI0018CD5577|nr:uncharacterized protein LOC119682039 [Teleopsis dalmanni]